VANIPEETGATASSQLNEINSPVAVEVSVEDLLVAIARASAACAERDDCRAASLASGLTSPVDHWLLPTRMQP